jgi:flagellum-specific peptidoglycan hydrolase FlgJ
VQSASKPWQQATALVSLGLGGAITGFSLIPNSPAELRSPSSLPVTLTALSRPAKPASTGDSTLRSAIVNVAQYYLRMAAGKSPGEMESIIWQHDSIGGVDHGESCAAFASLTLETAARTVGQESWVSGGGTYPWPLHKWADVRVDPNPASPGVISVVQDAEAHHRWHPLGDGYAPQPGDWVLFDGHVEVVTGYADGVLHTIGGDSLPNFSVNAHSYRDPLSADGVAGFVNNGNLSADSAAGEPAQASGGAHDAGSTVIPGAWASDGPVTPAAGTAGGVAIPGIWPTAPGSGASRSAPPHRAGGPSRAAAAGRRNSGQPGQGGTLFAGVPGTGEGGLTAPPAETAGAAAAIPGAPVVTAHRLPTGATQGSPSPYHRHQPSSVVVPSGDTGAQLAFIREVAPGALATQRQYGIPASVTIAQAIDESDWGRSNLARRDHNLFGIKGTGPAGTVLRPTDEYVNGQLVRQMASFRVYRNATESIEDHGNHIVTSGHYRHALADSRDPNAFANDLSGIYATDPTYGTQLIAIMRRYNLYRYDHLAPVASSSRAAPAAPGSSPGAGSGQADIPGVATAPVDPRSPGAPGQGRPPGGPHPASPDAAQGPAAQTSASPAPTSRPRSAPSPAAPAASTPAPEPSSATAAPPTPTGGLRTVTPAPSTPDPAPSTPAPARSAPRRARSASAPASATRKPAPSTTPPAQSIPGVAPAAAPTAQAVSATLLAAPIIGQTRKGGSRRGRGRRARYRQPIPTPVKSAFAEHARMPLQRSEPLYRDVADTVGIGWELLAACDWMQCEAGPHHSPVHGEKLGRLNPDGTRYRTKSEALEQCAADLAEFADAVYQIDLTAPGNLSVGELASAFAAFRWGGLLKVHHTSAMEFPYSVAGLTVQHTRMRWPNIPEPNAPDKPGSRFRKSFGAVPIVLSLGYPATV